MNRAFTSPPSTLPTGSKVIAYVCDDTISDSPNNKDGQEAAITNYCGIHGLVLTKIYKEIASGNSIDRAQFSEMVQATTTCTDDARPHGLLIFNYSRLSRNVSDLININNDMAKLGVIIHSLTDYQIDNSYYPVLQAVLNYIALERSISDSKSIKHGIIEKVKAGFSSGGKPPKGYCAKAHIDLRPNHKSITNTKWVKDLDILPMFKLAWDMRSQGKEYSDITKATHGKLYKAYSSWKYHFNNKSYLGIGKGCGSEIPKHHEPLITQDLWDAVQKYEHPTEVSTTLTPECINNKEGQE